MTRRTTTFPGVPFPEQAPRFIVPGLSLRQLRENRPLIIRFLDLEKKLRTAPDSDTIYEVIEGATKLSFLAVSRNYPDVQLEELEDLVDMSNFKSIIEIVMGNSGFALVTSLPQEAAVEQSGEPLASSQSTGAASTPA